MVLQVVLRIIYGSVVQHYGQKNCFFFWFPVVLGFPAVSRQVVGFSDLRAGLAELPGDDLMALCKSV